MPGGHRTCETCGRLVRNSSHSCDQQLPPQQWRSLIDEHGPEVVLDFFVGHWREFYWGQQVPAMIDQLR